MSTHDLRRGLYSFAASRLGLHSLEIASLDRHAKVCASRSFRVAHPFHYKLS